MIKLHRLLIITFILTSAIPAVKAQNDRLTAFISDTHFGVGKTSEGRWHPYEDARWSQDFALFLKELDRKGQGKTDLILNGDTFELWQSLENDCIYPSEDLGCTESDALNRLRIVIAAHTSELEVIRQFASAGNNTVTIVPGNHDAALTYAGVANEIVKAIGAPADRLRVAAQGYWISKDGLIYAEHGHQIGKDVNLFSNWPTPFIQKNGIVYLQRPWGEELVQRFYNQYEVRYPIIDNIQGDSIGIKYGIAAEGSGGLVKGFGKFVRFYFTQTSLKQFVQSVGPQQTSSDWDVKSIRNVGDRFFVDSIPEGDPLKTAAEQSFKENALGIKIQDLTDDEVRGICEIRADVVKQDIKNNRPARVARCPQRTLGGAAAAPHGTLGAAATAITKSRDSIFSKYLDETASRLRNSNISRQPFSLFVFSHTHLPEASYEPFRGSTSRWRPRVMNSGAWQRTISEDQLLRYMNDNGLKEKDVLKKPPEDWPACYPVILVSPYSQQPQGYLRFWRLTTGNWSFQDRCEP